MDLDWNFDLDRYINRVVPASQLPKLHAPVARFLGYRKETQQQEDVGNILGAFWSLFGAFCGLAVVAAVFNNMESIQRHHPPALIASFGASAILEYNCIRSPLGQPRNALLGHTFSALIGTGISKIFQYHPDYDSIKWVAGAVACGCASAFMLLTNTVHPPGGASAVLAATEPVITAMGWYFVALVMWGTTLMLTVGLLINNIQRQFPMYWWTPLDVRKAKLQDEEVVSDAAGGIEEKKNSEEADYDKEGQQIVISGAQVMLPEDLSLNAEETKVLQRLRDRLRKRVDVERRGSSLEKEDDSERSSAEFTVISSNLGSSQPEHHQDTMVSASKAARQAKRAADGDAKPKKTATSKLSSKANSKNPSKANSENGDEAEDLELNAEVAKLTMQEDKHGLSDRVTTGVLASLEQSRDVKIISASLVFHGKVLFNDSTLEINYGRRYGLLGENGCGKTTLLKAIDKREFPFPEHIDIYLLNQGAPKTELGALEWVVREAENELARLEKLAEEILEKDGPESPLLDDIYERQEDMDPSTFHTRASLILTGLGFNKVTINKKTKDMSGGWRMRVALAKALFVKPALLLLDDPTAHLDLEACVWLEEYMKKWERTLVLVSHSMDFLNGVCTNMIDMRQKKLLYYGGNYDTYHKTRTEQEVNQTKAYEKQQDEIKHIKKFIASAGTYANLVRQAKSRQKILDKMEADGLIEPVQVDRVFTFRFADVEKLPPPVLSLDDVTFSYSGDAKDNLYENLDFGVDMDSRTALVGPNGVGKSTLLNIFTGKLSPTSGVVSRHTHLKLGVYSQHSAEQLDLTKSALDFVRDKFHHISQDLQYWRQQLGRYGMTGEAQTSKMATLSDGQKSRIVFALLAIEGPNMLLLDEPTNGLDIPTIDSLADAINAFSGGVVVVSHDFRLLDKIAKDIMVCEHKTVRRWDGTIGEYKNHLRKKMASTGAL
ncbi:abc transporter atp-binding arb1 [Pyrenophora seminiperda CCB06]|uniref:Abc transporter atp-binding arb1 n=1 Tax=Pyrenophora seminiperda CCB06 TaxID=1302712 RepID=A0A3M7M8U9_9PLEO|nr:abc transporter atp-binding arb1 [Pyrenophora seminiperda CCB06]